MPKPQSLPCFLGKSPSPNRGGKFWSPVSRVGEGPRPPRLIPLGPGAPNPKPNRNQGLEIPRGKGPLCLGLPKPPKFPKFPKGFLKSPKFPGELNPFSLVQAFWEPNQIPPETFPKFTKPPQGPPPNHRAKLTNFRPGPQG